MRQDNELVSTRVSQKWIITKSKQSSIQNVTFFLAQKNGDKGKADQKNSHCALPFKGSNYEVK